MSLLLGGSPVLDEGPHSCRRQTGASVCEAWDADSEGSVYAHDVWFRCVVVGC